MNRHSSIEITSIDSFYLCPLLTLSSDISILKKMIDLINFSVVIQNILQILLASQLCERAFDVQKGKPSTRRKRFQTSIKKLK